MLYPGYKVNNYLKRRVFLWDTQKSIGEEENWDLKKDELAKEIKENKTISSEKY